MKDRWYLVAFGVVVSAVSLIYQIVHLLLFYDLWLLYLMFRRAVNRWVIIFCICVSTFFYYYFPPPNPPSVTEDYPKTETIRGKVVKSMVETDKKIEFVIKNQFNDPFLVLYFKSDHSSDNDFYIPHGANCSIIGERSIPDSATNPHQFDYQDYLWGKGISFQFIVSSISDISCVDASYLNPIYKLRHNIKNYTNERLESFSTKWLHPLVLGDDTKLDEMEKELFRTWGLSHLLAISGLHIGIVIASIYLIALRFTPLTKEATQNLLIIFLPVYALLAGGQPSVWRASVMVLLIIICTKFKWKVSYADVISLVFILFLVIDKQIIYHVGFQLSFAVTFALILSRKWIASSSAIASLFKISFISQMAILPLQLHYFSHFQPLSILLNIIMVPYFSLFVIPFMFFLLIGSILPKTMLLVPENIFRLIQQFVMEIVKLIDHYMDYPFLIGNIPLIYIVIYYVILVSMMVNLENNKRMKGFYFGCLLSILIIFLAIRPYLNPYGTVTMLDIGQGDAFVIEMPYRKGVFLIDAGASFSFTDMKASNRIYTQIIKPYLRGQGIYRLDAIFISHEDLDHDGSVSYILEDFYVDNIIVSPFYEFTEENMDNWKNIYITSYRETLQLHNQLFYILSPSRKTDSANENSLVIFTEIGGLSWLFTGDIGKVTEREILLDFPHLPIDIIKVGHHGSNTSTDLKLAERGAGGFALISVGAKNNYGHPTNEVISTLEKQNITIYRTDRHGAVQFRFKNNSGRFHPFLKNEK